ncbi:hypothetical protein [Planctellipticum variicoloris]|uniref:hypothetical protein n=1 Tax=Planctellipticum variicoloris TaxID=3064265 RepID=UPI0030135475|nr:hypothetical protein SH412_000953 [Planctomycetaceae bacterium SH412]
MTTQSAIEDDIDAERESLEEVLQDVKQQEEAELEEAKRLKLVILRDKRNPGASQNELRQRAIKRLLESIQPETFAEVTESQRRFRQEFLEAEQSGPLMNAINNARAAVERCEEERRAASVKLAALEMQLEQQLQNAESIPPDEEQKLFAEMSQHRFTIQNFDVKLRILRQKQEDAEKELPELRSRIFSETHAKFSREIRETMKDAEAKLCEIIFTEEVISLLNTYATAADQWRFFGPAIAYMMMQVQQEGPIGGLRHVWGDWRPTDHVIGATQNISSGGGGSMGGLGRDYKDSQGGAFGGGGPLDKFQFSGNL